MKFIQYLFVGLIVSYVLYQLINVIIAESEVVSIGLVICSILCGCFGTIIDLLIYRSSNNKEK